MVAFNHRVRGSSPRWGASFRSRLIAGLYIQKPRGCSFGAFFISINALFFLAQLRQIFHFEADFSLKSAQNQRLKIHNLLNLLYSSF
jgi:hypothetical protein